MEINAIAVYDKRLKLKTTTRANRREFKRGQVYKEGEGQGQEQPNNSLHFEGILNLFL